VVGDQAAGDWDSGQSQSGPGYQELIGQLLARWPENRIEPTLVRIASVVELLGDPQRAYPVIHVTGTNGKGSTSRMITELLRASGLRVGTYSSPHLERINERLAIDSSPIGDEELAELITAVARVEPLSGIVPSYFELVTASALLWFAESAVDVAVVEVGLLGRFDATNVCDASVAVVTNICRDHTDGVGDWRAAIASEKAGIIRSDSTLVTGVDDPELRAILLAEGPERAFANGVDFEVLDDRPSVGGRVMDIVTPWARHDDVVVPLHGRHQSVNAAIALVAVEAFFDRALDDAVVLDGMSRVEVPGRCEVVHRAPLVVLDGAHNPEGARSLVTTFREEFDVPGRLVVVVGMLEGRDVADMLRCLSITDADLVIACRPPSPRAVPAEDIAAVARAMGVLVEQVDDVASAVGRAVDVSTSEDAVLVAGSLYVVGAARAAMPRILPSGD